MTGAGVGADGGGPGDYADAVLDVVERIPSGWVLSYGDVAQIVAAAGPRQVGTVLARYGSHVPWWRVVRADGTPAPQLALDAAERYAAEGTPLRSGAAGSAPIRVAMGLARWQPAAQDLPPPLDVD